MYENDSFSIFDYSGISKKSLKRHKKINYTEDDLLIEDILNLIKNRSGKHQEKQKQILALLKGKESLINKPSISRDNRKLNIAYYSLRYLPSLFAAFIAEEYPVDYDFVSKGSKKTLLLGLTDSRAVHSRAISEIVIKNSHKCINFFDRRNKSALFYALENNKIDIAYKLLDTNLIDFSDNKIKDIFSEAIACQNKELILFFSDTKVKLNFVNDNDFSLPYYDSYEDNYEKKYNAFELITPTINLYGNALKEKYCETCLNILKQKGFNFENGLKNNNLPELIIRKNFTADNILFLAKENPRFAVSLRPKSEIFILLNDLLYRDKNIEIVNKLNIMDTEFSHLNILDAIQHNFMRGDHYYNDKVIFTFDNFNKFNDILSEVLNKNINLNKEISTYQYYSYSRSYYGSQSLKNSENKIEIRDEGKNRYNFIFYLIQHINFFINHKDYDSMVKQIHLQNIQIKSIRNKSFQLLKQTFKQTDLKDTGSIIYNITAAFRDNTTQLKELLILMVNQNLTINCSDFSTILKHTDAAFHSKLLEYYFQKNEMNIVNYFKEKFCQISDLEANKKEHIINIFNRISIQQIILLKDFLESQFQITNSIKKSPREQLHQLIKHKMEDRIIEHEKEVLLDMLPSTSLNARTNRI